MTKNGCKSCGEDTVGKRWYCKDCRDMFKEPHGKELSKNV